MQKITAILKTGTSGAVISDEYGNARNKTLELVLGTAVELTLDLRCEDTSPENAELMPLDGNVFNSCHSFFFAVDNDFDHSTVPLFLKTGGIQTVTGTNGTFIKVVIENTAVDSLIGVLGKNRSGDFTCELAGLDENGTANFSWLFPITFRNRIFMGSNAVPDSVLSDPAYMTSAEVKALLASGIADAAEAEALKHLPDAGPNGNWFVGGRDTGISAAGKEVIIRYSADGVAWSETPDDCTFISFSTDNGETWSDAFYVKGEQGVAAGFGTPTASVVSVPYGYPAKATVDASGPDTAKVFNIQLEIPQGKQGEKGDRGAAFKIDATGTLAERAQYDNQPKDFSFLATDDGNVYVKVSDTSGDWSDPIPFKGDKGDTGKTGAVFTPTVDEDGNLSWSNDGNLVNPETVNIKGKKGDKGETGSVENLRLEITSVENGSFLVDNDNFFPVAVLTASGKCYPLEKESLHKAETGWHIDIAKYLAYDNVAEFTAPWFVYCSGGVKGEDGWSFNPDARGFASEKSDYDNEAKGFAFLAFDEGNIYFKNSNTAGDWSSAVPFRGEQGAQGLPGLPGEDGIPGPMADVLIGDNGNWIVNGVDTGKKATGAGSNVIVSPTPPSTVYNGLIWVQSNNSQYLNIDPINVITSSAEPDSPANGTIWIESEV